MIIKTFYNYDPSQEKNNPGLGELITIPDQSLTVKQILERFRRGTLDYSALQNKGYYDDQDSDIDTPIPEMADLTDLQTLVENAQTKLTSLSSTPPSSVETSDSPDSNGS